jgi:predicted glycoside hydrolase/deacetylase ChbG (UPF0249 family)
MSPRPLLIVNGDDFGRTESSTQGVMQAFRRGILTSTSIVASSRCFDQAVRLAKQQPELSVGVHLVVDEYTPVSSPRDIPSLVGPDGRFPSRASALGRILLGRVSREEIRREWQAQLRKVVSAGIRPSHVDGHGHCHASPPLAKLLAEIAAEFEIAAVRLPAEPLARLGDVTRFSPRRYAEKLLVSSTCIGVRSRWKGRLHFPDSFFGFMEGGRLDARSLESIAASLEPGVSELMAHPGISNDDHPYSIGYNWRGDLEALTKYSKRRFEERFGVRLVSYRDAWKELQ